MLELFFVMSQRSQVEDKEQKKKGGRGALDSVFDTDTNICKFLVTSYKLREAAILQDH